MLIGFLLAVLVGVTLGLVGSGGTILTLPILVYVMGVDPVLATTYSLFSIGVSSMVGAVRGFVAREIDVRRVFAFGLPSLLMVFVMRTFILPLVPEVIAIGPWEVRQSILLMLLFAVVMSASSIAMIRETGFPFFPSVGSGGASARLVVLFGLFVGMVTGTVGAGGGFLIIPALIHFFKMPMKNAVSTSLVIIAVNSLFGVLGDLEKLPVFDWTLILGYTIFVVSGIFVGFGLSGRMDGRKLGRLFGWLILLMGIYVVVREVFRFGIAI